MTDLLERLLQVEGRTTQYYRNPDGPEAADEIKQLRAEVADLLGLKLALDAPRTVCLDVLKQASTSVDIKPSELGLLPERDQLRARVAELEDRLQIARGALADIAGSKDMTLTIARVKSRRVYDETAAK